MSPQGRPKGEYRRAQPEGAPISPQGRPKGEYRRAQPEAAPLKRRALLGGGLGLALGLGSAGIVSAAAAPAIRLISIGSGCTEAVYALRAEAAIVGVDDGSEWPAAARQLPHVGYQRQLSVEGLLSLRPGALLTTAEAGPPAVIEQLQRAGVRVERIPASHDAAEVRGKILAAGRLLGREPQAQALLQTFDEEWAAARSHVALTAARWAHRPRVLFVLTQGGAPMAAGSGTGAAALIEMAGGENVLAAQRGYRALTQEAMPQAAPDVVLMMEQSLALAGGPDRFWSGQPLLATGTPAGRARRLVAMEAGFLLGFGPRLPQAVRALNTELGQSVGHAKA